jgi:hypothetical protein
MLPYRARASKHGTVIAESTAAIRLDVAGAAPVLLFPRADVDDLALDRLDPDHWWTGAPRHPDHVAFDHEEVDLALVDAMDGDDERDVTIKRFPTWGDAADLIDVLDVRPDGPLRFTTAARSDWRRPVVVGSQMLGQAIGAAGRHSPGRRVASASMVFTRAADARLPCALELDEVALGRTFSTLGVRVTQGERTCATGTLLLDVTSPDEIRHADPAPDVPGP